MDIELLSKMVGELILDHDEVGLPGLGSFVAELVPASFSDRGYTVNPPYRRMIFVPGPSEDDSLVRLYAESNSLDVGQSRTILTRFLERMRSELENRKTLTFPGLGKLKSVRDNRFFFVADENLDIYPEGFGLAPISLKTHGEPSGRIVDENPDTDAVVLFREPPVVNAPVLETDAVPETDAGSEPISAPGPVREPVEETDSAPAGEAPDSGESLPAGELELAGKPVRKLRKLLLTIIIVLAVLALLAGAFRLLAFYAPDFVDSLLYTPEELRIINY